MKIFLSFLGLSFLYLLVACSKSNPGPKIVPVNENQDNSTVELLVGDQIEISLPGNPTTGYEWTLRTVDKTILEPLGQPEYKSEGDALGAGGLYTLRLKAVATGESWVEMVYRRPFDQQEVPSLAEYRILVKVTR